jgi:TPP-dependent 2-oxoacid decarboxylase
MQVCWTFLAIGYTVTAVKEPMAVGGMWEENKIIFIGEGAFRIFTIRAQRNT